MNYLELIENIRWKVEMMTTTEKVEDRVRMEREIKKDLERLEEASVNMNKVC